MSARWSHTSPGLHSSGATTAGMWPPPPAITRRPSPKFITFTRSSPPITRFDARRSPWITPCAWACSSPRHTCDSHPVACGTLSGPSARTSRTVRPSSHSWITHTNPSLLPKSKIRTRFGCSSGASSRASAMNASASASSPATSTGRIFSATGRSRDFCTARNTVPSSLTATRPAISSCGNRGASRSSEGVLDRFAFMTYSFHSRGISPLKSTKRIFRVECFKIFGKSSCGGAEAVGSGVHQREPLAGQFIKPRGCWIGAHDGSEIGLVGGKSIGKVLNPGNSLRAPVAKENPQRFKNPIRRRR